MPDGTSLGLCAQVRDRAAAQSALAAILPVSAPDREWACPEFPGLPAVLFQRRRASRLREKISTCTNIRAVTTDIPRMESNTCETQRNRGRRGILDRIVTLRCCNCLQILVV